jgi:AbiV family abortive infection protein
LILKVGIKLCTKKIAELLHDAEILCKNGGSDSSVVVIYSVAVEEYGKSLMLERILLETNKVEGKFLVKKSIFGVGHGGHEEKISAAFKVLPSECINYVSLDPPDEENKVPLKARREIEELKEFKKKTESGNPNANVKIGYVTAFDFEIRKNLLYIDWDDLRNEWKPALKVTKEEFYEVPSTQGWDYDPNIKTYTKIEKIGDQFRGTVTSHPTIKIRLSPREVFERELLVAIDSFREHVHRKISKAL